MMPCNINIKVIASGKWKENCYIISKNNNEAVIIDPGLDEKRIVKYINTH
ncbi:uncharacterized protein METZ01_LOCUS469397, partial [marine metagenome]